MITINLTTDQFHLIVSALEVLYETDLETIGFYSSPEHFNKEELDGFCEERDSVCKLLKYLHDQSLKAVLEGGEENEETCRSI